MANNMNCTGCIKGTFVACGEGNNYCSSDCMNKAIFVQLENLNKAIVNLSKRLGGVEKRLYEVQSLTNGLKKC